MLKGWEKENYSIRTQQLIATSIILNDSEN